MGKLSYSDVLRYAVNSTAGDKAVKTDLYAKLMYLESLLVPRGFHKMSRWWRTTLQAFWRSNRKRLVIRVGRRGGKSSTLCRVAVVEALYGNYNIPAGDIGVFAFVSITRKEARQRLETIRQILDILGVKYHARADELQIYDRPICFRVYSCSFRTSVGFTCIGMVGDEVARWRDDDTGANPATEVLRSMRPAMATMPSAHEYLSSSPWSTLDTHYDHCELGTTELQQFNWATTWVANPSLSEAECRVLEADEETFQREYGAKPMRSGASTFFDPLAIEQALDTSLVLPRLPREGEHTMAGGDFGFRSDFSALVVSHRMGDKYVVGEMLELRPEPNLPLRPSHVCKTYAEVLYRHGTRALMADHHYRESVVEHLSEHDIGFIDAPRQPDKSFIKLRTLLNQGRIRLPGDDTRLGKQLVRDMKAVQSRPTRGGGLTIVMPRRQGGGHCDLVSALVLSVWATKGQVYTYEAPDPFIRMAKSERDMIDEYEAELKELENPGMGDGPQYSEEEWITGI